MPDTNIETRQNDRARKRKRKKRIKRTLLITFCLLVITAAFFVVRYISLDTTYKNEEQFNEYTKICFDEIDNIRTYVAETEKEIVSYNKPLSIAIKYPVIGMEKLDGEIEECVNNEKNSFYSKYEELDKREKTLRVMNYELFITQRDVTSVVLVVEDKQKDKFDMVSIDKYVYIYNYFSETGEPLNGLQIFNIGYKEFFAEYLDDYFKAEYGDKLKDNYGDYLEINEENFNNFVLTDGGVRFYYQPGTILKKSEGIITAEISYSNLENIIKKKATIRYIDPSKPMVALTYDDGPYPKVSNRILSCLSKYDSVATFFMLGENVERYPKTVKRKAQLGMEIGSHTWSHPNLSTLSRKEIKREITKTNNALMEACEQKASVFRPPYGIINEEDLELLNMPAILWSVDTLDWESRKSKSIVKLVKKIEKEDGLDGRVILMHSLYPSTAKATEILVPWLKEQGYQLVTVSELLEYRYHEIPEDEKLYGYDYFYIEE